MSLSIKGLIRSGAKHDLYEEVMEAISQPGSIHHVLRDVSFSTDSEHGRGYVDLRLPRKLAIELRLLR
jgi:hypothetical protein